MMGIEWGFHHHRLYPSPDMAMTIGRFMFAGRIERGLPKRAESESASPGPPHLFAYSALLSFDDFLKAGDAVCARMVTHLDADVAAIHLVRHCGSST